MRPTELHPSLKATRVPVPEHSGTFAVVPRPAPRFVEVPSCHTRIVQARREMDLLIEEVPRLMADLEGLLGYEPEGPAIVSILMRAAIAHVQFEAIHPFRDGNGRIGRLLLPLMFKAEGEPPVHLATFLKVRKREYYSALESAQKRLDWAPWLKLFLECVIASCRYTVRLFSALRAIQNRWYNALSEAGKRSDAAVWKISELLLGQPVVTVNAVVKRIGVSFPTASAAVAELADLGILRQENAGQRRRRVFHAHEILNALHTGMDDVLLEIERTAREIGAR